MGVEKGRITEGERQEGTRTHQGVTGLAQCPRNPGPVRPRTSSGARANDRDPVPRVLAPAVVQVALVRPLFNRLCYLRP
eukprot:3507928-Rhodomonas_salina.2